MPTKSAEPMQMAVRLLARRPLSAWELEEKLQAQGVSSADIARTIDSCKDHRYINDANLAELMQHKARQQGKGPMWLERTLTRRGISAATAAGVLRIAHAEAPTLAAAVVAKRFAHGPKDDRERAKMGRFLEQRGFPRGLVAALFGHVDDCTA